MQLEGNTMHLKRDEHDLTEMCVGDKRRFFGI